MIQTLKRWMRGQFGVFLACITVFSAFGLHAQTAWPQKTVRFIVPLPPGGGADIVARTVAERLSKNLGQQVLVDTRLQERGFDVGDRVVAIGSRVLVGTSRKRFLLDAFAGEADLVEGGHDAELRGEHGEAGVHGICVC